MDHFLSHAVCITLLKWLCVTAVIQTATAVSPAVADDDDDDNYSTLSWPSDVMEVANAESQQTAIERDATSANALISNYILAKLFGTPPTRLPTGAILPPDILPHEVSQLPISPFPVIPRADVEDDSRQIASEPGVHIAAANNRSKVSGDDSSEVEETGPADVLSSLHHGRRRPRPHVNTAEELLIEWKGDHGQARSVSNTANNFVVFAPLSPSRAVRKPAATSVRFQSSPPSTAPASSLRAVVEKSAGELPDDYTPWIRKDVAPITADDDRLSGNSSMVELDEFKSGPAAADMVDEHEEDIGLIAQDQDYVTPVTGFHLRPRLFPGSAQPHDVAIEEDGAAPVSLLLPPDNAPWTISEDRELTAPDRQLPVTNGDQSEDDDTTPTQQSRKSTRATSVGDNESSVATTDPTVHMYTLLTAAGSRSDDSIDDVKTDVEDDVGDDAKIDVGLDDEDVQSDVGDVAEVVGEDQESELTELRDGDDNSSPTVLQDSRRLSAEFLRAMQSLWPGLEICAGPQCSIKDTTRQTDLLASSPDVDDVTTASPASRRSNEYEFPAVKAWKLKFAVSDSKHVITDKDVDVGTVLNESLTTSTISAGGVASRPVTTPSLWQVRGSTLRKTDSTTAAPRHTLLRKLIDNITADQLTAVQRKDARPNATAAAAVGNEKRMTSGKDRPERPKITVTLSPTTTASDVLRVGDVYYRKPSRRQRLSTSSSMKSVDARRNRPAMNVPRTRIHDGPIRRLVRPFYLHPSRTDPTRREKSHGDTRQRPLHPRHGFLPPTSSSGRSPTIVRPRPDSRAELPGRRRSQTVGRNSGLVRNSDPALQQTNEETRLQHLGSDFTVAVRRTPALRSSAVLPSIRTAVFASEGEERKKLLERTTTSTLTGMSMDGIRSDDNSAPKAIVDGTNEEITGMGRIKDMLRTHILQSSSEKKEREKITRLEQTTQLSNNGASLHRRMSKTDRGQNVSDERKKMAQEKFSDDNRKASLSPWLSETITESVTRERSTRGEVDEVERSSALSTATSTQPLHSRITASQQQATSDDVEEALTSTSSPPTVSDQRQTTADRPLAVDSEDVSPGGSEPLPVHARPGEDGRSAAAIAMLGGYADWMVGLISAVAVAVFIFLAILSFLAVVSCRCVSAR